MLKNWVKSKKFSNASSTRAKKRLKTWWHTLSNASEKSWVQFEKRMILKMYYKRLEKFAWKILKNFWRSGALEWHSVCPDKPKISERAITRAYGTLLITESAVSGATRQNVLQNSRGKVPSKADPLRKKTNWWSQKIMSENQNKSAFTNEIFWDYHLSFPWYRIQEKLGFYGNTDEVQIFQNGFHWRKKRDKTSIWSIRHPRWST